MGYSTINCSFAFSAARGTRQQKKNPRAATIKSDRLIHMMETKMTVVDGVVFLDSALIVISLIVGAVFFIAYSRKAPSEDD